MHHSSSDGPGADRDRERRRRALVAVATVALFPALIAAGGVPAARNPPRYLTDPSAWTRTEVRLAPEILYAPVKIGSSFVAFANERAAVSPFRSKDGKRWKPVSAKSTSPGAWEAANVAATATGGPGGAIAVGSTGSSTAPKDRTPVFWLSKDGKHWKRYPGKVGAFGGPGASVVTDVVPARPGWLAVGSASAGANRVGALWTSRDGKRWTRLYPESPEFAVAGQSVFVNSITKGPKGLVAVGERREVTPGGAVLGHPLAWVSKDASRWARVDIPQPIGITAGAGGSLRMPLVDVAATDKRYVAVGPIGKDADVTTTAGGVVLQSTDGRTWVAASVTGGTFQRPGATVRGVAATGSTVLVIGQESFAAAGLWTSSDGGKTFRPVSGPPIDTQNIVNTFLTQAVIKKHGALMTGYTGKRGTTTAATWVAGRP